jgi:hypothetical protein
MGIFWNSDEQPRKEEVPISKAAASTKSEEKKAVDAKEIPKKEILQLAKTNLQAQIANCKINTFHSALSGLVNCASKEKKVYFWFCIYCV